ncbi:MAG: methyl-accepting chemotaxis protein [Planctomycetota bacterium]|nr:methyl-accepting chemotaxis protein [Planctomycetota bacterium]
MNKSSSKDRLFTRLIALVTGELLLTLLVLSIAPLLILGITVYQYVSRLQASEAEKALELDRFSKSAQIEHYFESIHDQVRIFSEDLMVIEAMRDFTAAYQELDASGSIDLDASESTLRESLKDFYSTEFAGLYKKETEERPAIDAIVQPLDKRALYLQNQYIAQNQYPLGSKDLYDSADDGTSYSLTHRKYHPKLRRYRETFGFYDLFLVDAETGAIVYSVCKEADYATSLRRGPFANSNLADVFAEAENAGWGDYVSFSDYEAYEPSFRNPASFIGSPIFHEGKKIGVLVFQMPIAQIDEIMQGSGGASANAEIYAVGSDHLIRNNIQSEEGFAARILKTRVFTVGSREPFGEENQSGVGRYPGRTGELALQSWGRVVVHASSGGDPVTWALVSEIPVEIVEKPTEQIFWFTLIVTGVSAGLVGIVAIGISRRFSSQHTRQQDLVRAIGDNMQTLASASEELSSVSEHMSSAAEETTAQARVVSEAADHVSENTRNVSSGLETFSVSVREVATSAGEAALVANQAVDMAKVADNSINQLGESSQRIGEIVSVITSIAEQTNLLALNATIEAARAGEAGKGFAVVAGEVKELAKETAAATNNIRDSIDQIRGDTQNAVQAINDITNVVDSICQQENTIASAVEEQTSTTSEISRNLAESAAGTAQIAQNMTQVAQAAQSTAEGASNTQAAALDLSRMASNLQRLVEEYREV